MAETSLLDRLCFREEEFRVDGVSAFQGLFVVLLAVGGTSALVGRYVWNRDFDWVRDLVAAPLLYAVMLAAAVWYLRRRLTVRVMPEGLQTFDDWGRDHLLPWDRFASVRRWSLFGLMPSARVRSRDDGPALWLPLNLAERTRFDNLVAEYTEPNHPLRRVLQTPPG